MKVMSLFFGIGGFDFAAKLMGWQTAVIVEWDKTRQQWAKLLYPDATIHGDIDTFDGRPYREQIDIITGGDPCQPNSVAGERAGENDPRFKWPHMLRTINEVRPLWVVNENVPGSISNGVLDRKISELEAINYATWPPLVIPAGVTGALHRRDRVLLVAYSLCPGRKQFNPTTEPKGETKGTVRNSPKYTFESRHEPWNPDTSEILREAIGISSELPAGYRNKAIESYGNAVHPAVILPIFQAIQYIEFTNQQ